MSIFDTYYPSGDITSGTRLGPGITCAKFLGARGSRTNWERHDEFGNPDRQTIAQNLYQHARAMQTVYSNFDFNEVRLTVSDGVYTPAEGESAGGINIDRVTGKAVGYQMIDKSGNVDNVKNYELAVYWKDYLTYESISLQFDTFDISGALVSTVFLVDPYNGSGKTLETTFNGVLQSAGELLEILE